MKFCVKTNTKISKLEKYAKTDAFPLNIIVPRMVTYVTKYAVDVPHEQTAHQISNANKQTDCMEIILNKVCYPY